MASITFEQMKTIAPRGKEDALNAVVKFLDQHGEEYGLTTPVRTAHFIAQLAHESDGFRATEEYASGAAYEGRMSLGNTEEGDGMRFKGRGFIMLTGRKNYTEYGEKLGVDLVNHPEKAAEPEIAMKIAAQYWKDNNLNELADKNAIVGITQKINGGVNGFDNRKAYFIKAAEQLGDLDRQTAEVQEISGKDLWGPGQKGPHISALQTELNEKMGSYMDKTLDVDGKYGPAMVRAVKLAETKINEHAQRDVLHIDGIADPLMREELHKYPEVTPTTDIATTTMA